jgi:cell wall-associated NlpC family hydrolase
MRIFHNSPKFAHRFLRATATLAISAGCLGAYVIVTAGPAAAWSGPSKIISSAPLDWCPGTAQVCQDNERVTTLGAGTLVTMQCWIDDRYEPGFAYPRWFYVHAGSAYGFVKAELVSNQNPNTPNCANVPAVAAILWGTSTDQFHQLKPTAQDRALAAQLWGITNWTLGGTTNGWSGNCVIFAGLAWHAAGVAIKTGPTAARIATEYRLADTLNPPPGALVFWGGSFGHVAVSLGNGQVVGTQGFNVLEETVRQTIAAVTSSSGYPYLGWVAIP